MPGRGGGRFRASGIRPDSSADRDDLHRGPHFGCVHGNPVRKSSNMRGKLLRGLAISVAVAVATVAIPNSAYAALEDGSSTLLTNYGNGLCAGVAGGSSKVQDGAAIIAWTCNASDDQTWVVSIIDPHLPSGPYFIFKNRVATLNTNNGAPLAQEPQGNTWFLATPG